MSSLEEIQSKLRSVTKIKASEKVSRTAIEFLTQHDANLVYCRSWRRFLIFNGIYYERLRPDTLQAMVFDFLQGYDINWDPTPSFLGQVIGMLKLKVDRVVDDEDLSHNHFAFKNTLLNTDTLSRSPFNPSVLCFKYIDCELPLKQTSTPNFDAYLATSLVDSDGVTDDKLRLLYQEMVAAIFSADSRASKVFFLQGDGKNGKSVTTELLIKIFGQPFVSAANLQTLTSSQFGKQTLVGKILNVCSEEESQRIKNDILKTLVTGELVQGERKFEDSFEFHNFAKFIFATNDVPQFTSIDYAMRRRLQLIPWLKRIKNEDRDHDLGKKLIKEIPGIVFWALEGLKRLQATGFEFTESATNMEAFEDMVQNMGSVHPFVSQTYVVDFECDPIQFSSSVAESETIYSKYASWCSGHGYLKMNASNFGRQLTKIVGKAARVRKRTGIHYFLREVGVGSDLFSDAEEATPDLAAKLGTSLPF